MNHVDVNVKRELRELVTAALEDQDWQVESVVTLLANEIKFVVQTYEDD